MRRGAPRRYKRTLDHQGHRQGGGQATFGLPLQHRPYQAAMANLTIDRKVILCCKPSINDAAL